MGDLHFGSGVILPSSTRAMGTYVLGTNGTGKTTLLENLVVQDMEAGLGVGVFDPHRDAINRLLTRVPRHREKDVVLLDVLDPEYSFGLNIYACDDPVSDLAIHETHERAMRVFKKIWGPGSPEPSWGPQLEDLLANVAHLAIRNPGTTLTEVPAVIHNAFYRTQLLRRVEDPTVRAFWELEFGQMKPDDQRDHARSTMNKIRPFVTHPMVRTIVGQAVSTVDFSEVLDAGKILFLQLSARHEELTGLIGGVVIGQLFAAALSRERLPPEQRRPFALYCDEYQLYATPDFARFLAEARKYAIYTTIAHQFRDQFDREDKNRGAALNANTKVFFTLTSRDADELASVFRTDPVPVEDRLEMVTEPAGTHEIRRTWTPPEAVDQWLELQLQVQALEREEVCLTKLFSCGTENHSKEPKDGKLIPWVLSQLDCDTCRPWFYRKFVLLDPKDRPDERWHRAIWSVMRRPTQIEMDLYCAFYIGGWEGQEYRLKHIKDWQEHQAWAKRFWPKLHALVSEHRSRLPTRDYLASWEEMNRYLEIPAFLVFAKTELYRCLEALQAAREHADSFKATHYTESAVFIPSGYELPVKEVVGMGYRGQPEEVNRYKRVPGSPRAFADVRNENANKLANLPRFTAMVKVDGAEFTIQTNPLAATTGSDPDEIRRESRNRYYKPRAVVDAEIRARYHDTDDGPPLRRSVA